MCGRYASTKGPATLAGEFDATDATGADAPGPDHNVAPTKRVLAVVARQRGDEQPGDQQPGNERPGNDQPGEVPPGEQSRASVERSLRIMRWGLVPSWATGPSVGARMINARAESAATKPAFRRSLAHRRCLLPADGWFEWARVDGRKQPYYTSRTDGAALAFAGIWTTWRDPADAAAPLLVTCAVLTTASVGPLADVHERMPLLLNRADWASWLDPESTDVGELLRPPPADMVAELDIRPVSTAVNNVRNNGPELLARWEPAADTQAADLDALTLFDSPALGSPVSDSPALEPPAAPGART